MRNTRFLVLLLVGAILLVPTLTRAQSVASVTGTVIDSSGAAVPGASITLVDTRTNSSYFGKTAGDGSYRISEVPPGPGYSLTVKKDGFQVFVLNSLYLPVATTTTQDVRLELGTVSQQVEVTAEGSISLDTTDTTIGNNFDMRAVETLPNEFRDDPSNLLRLEVGVISALVPAGSATIDPNGTRDGAVAGARADQDVILVDGIEATDFSAGFAFATQAAIPVEAIQEFSTQVANPSPQYGGRSGAQAIITTKSGSNTFHGTAYEYNRNAATEANTFFNKQADVPRQALVRNQFGANFGGPAWKDKLFFFFEYDGRRDAKSQGVLRTVPMPHVKLGELAYVNSSGGGSCDPHSRLTSADVGTPCVTILSAAQVAKLDPCSTVDCTGTSGFVSPGMAPALQSLFSNRYPNPNDFSRGDGLNTAGFRFNAPDPLIENDYFARSDYVINANNKLFVRFNFANVTGVQSPNRFPGDPLTSPNLTKDRAWVVGETWTAGPNFVNQFTYGETRANIAQPVPFNPSGPLYELTFFSGILSNPFNRQSATGVITPEPTFRDDVTWVRGKHTFMFGGEWHPVRVRDVLTNDFTFIQQGLGGNIPSLPAYNAANPINVRPSDLLQDSGGIADTNWDGALVGALGSMFNVQAAFNYTGKGVALAPGSSVRHDWRLHEIGTYFQDSWKLRRDLTVTMAVRYQYQSVPYETNGTEAQFLNTNFKSLMEARIQNGLAGISGPGATPQLTYQLTGKANHAPGLYSPEYHDFSPRLGIAWNPSFHDGFLGGLFGDHKTVIRTGASIIYDQTVVNNIVHLEDQSDYTFGDTFAQTFGISGNVLGSVESEPRFNSFNSVPFMVPVPPFITPITPSAIFNDAVDNQLRTPYSIAVSFGFQRELPFGLQWNTDYYGRFGRRLFALADASQLVNFTDAASKQSLSSAFTVLELAARAGAAGVPDQKFFENQLNPSFGGPTGCMDTFGVSCTTLVYSSFPTGLAQGNTAGIWFSLPFQTNVGFVPQFLVNAIGTNLGNSSYNALFSSLRKRLSNGLQFDLNYTYSHSIDNNSDVANENGNFANGVTAILCDATNAHVCRGNSEFDATHQISADFIYDLPFGRGKAFGHNVGRLVDEAIGGWQVAGIQTWRTGLAQTVGSGVASTTSLAADAGSVFIGPKSALQSSIHIDPTDGGVQFYKNRQAAINAFVPVTGLQSGTRDNLRGPHLTNLDVAVVKNFPLWTETYRLQFRAEAYNVFNHTNFGLPDPNLASPTFGEMSDLAGSEPSRVMQFALRFEF